jgi:hypothetical protein
VREQGLARRGQPDRGPVADEKGLAELGFQAADLLADRRLRDRDALRCAREVTSSATATKYASWRSSIRERYRIKSSPVFDLCSPGADDVGMNSHPQLDALPQWPQRTIALLATLDDGGPFAIPVSAPVRAGERRILLSLHDRSWVDDDGKRALGERVRALRELA